MWTISDTMDLLRAQMQPDGVSATRDLYQDGRMKMTNWIQLLFCVVMLTINVVKGKEGKALLLL